MKPSPLVEILMLLGIIAIATALTIAIATWEQPWAPTKRPAPCASLVPPLVCDENGCSEVTP